MKKSALIVTLNIVAISFLLVAQTVASNRLATGGVLLGKIEEKSRWYQTENTLLAEEISLSSSLTQIASKAAQLGFIENKSTFVLTNSKSLASVRP